MLYEITIDDPTTWTRPWTAMIRLRQTDERLYEFACHEGNADTEAGILLGAHAAGIVGRIAWGAVADRWLTPRSMLGLLGAMMALSGAGVAGFSTHWPLWGIIVVSALLWRFVG